MADCPSTYEQKLAELQKTKAQVDQLTNIVNSKEKNVAIKESLSRQGQVPNYNARDLEFNMRNNLGVMSPGNLGDISKVIWPFYFSTGLPGPIGFNQTFQSSFTVTQEAAFILMSFTKVIYRVNPNEANRWEYLDPNNSAAPGYLAPGLSFTLRDGSSSRQFFNIPMQVGNYGNPRFPTKLPRPMMFLPRHQVQVSFNNSQVGQNYVPIMTFFGYRVRIEEAYNLLGLVFA